MTAPAPDPRLWANICRQCGQSQNDDFAAHGIHAPMLHVAREGANFQSMTAEDIHSYHLDCMPHAVEAQHRDQHGVAIDAAKSGQRGQELHATIHTAREAFEAMEARFLADNSGNDDPNIVHPMVSGGQA